MNTVRTFDGDLTAELEGARSLIEVNFIAAGEILARSIDGIDGLIELLQTLIKALDENAVAAMTEDMKVAAETLLRLSDNHQGRLHAMDLLGRHRENLVAHVADMHSNLAYMRAFTVNIKIVSSGIAEAGSTFESFAQEISDCIETGRDELLKIEIDNADLKCGLAATHAQSVRLALHLTTLLPALPNRLCESATMMAQHYSRVLLIADEVSGIARDVHKRVVRVLQALQIGDSTRQRVEHLQAMLNAIEHKSEAGDNHFAGLCYALLKRQLAATKADFDQEVDEIERAMADMAEHARNLMKLRDMAYGSHGEKGHGFLDDLLAGIESALVLVGEIEGADSAALKTGRDTAESAAHLEARISAIQSLKNDVQYMALNTTIRCAQIGEAARPLSVIAVELRDHGVHLEGAANRGLAELADLKAAADLLVSAGQGNGKLTATDALGVATRLICEARQRTEVGIDALVLRGEDVLAILDESVERLAFATQIASKFDVVAESLTAIAAVQPSDAAACEAQLTAFFDKANALYTMKQERDVHKAFVQWLGLAQAPTVSAYAA